VQAASVKVSEIRKFRRSAGNYSYQSIFLLAEERHAIQAQSDIVSLFVRLISHQPAVLFSQNKPATSNQPTVFFSHNKSAQAISHQPNEQAQYC
jgi:hypothetical protein